MQHERRPHEIEIPPCGLWRRPPSGKMSKHLRLANLGVPKGKDCRPPKDCFEKMLFQIIIHQPFGEATNSVLGEGEITA